MTESIVVAIITGCMALVGTIISNVANNSKTMYRIEQLEKKQDIHNCVIERMYNLESCVDLLDERIKVANHRIDALEHDSDK